MICPACGTENRSDRKFCSQCGTALALPCPSCGASNDPSDAFCGQCGSPLAAEAPAAAPGATSPSAPASQPPAGSTDSEQDDATKALEKALGGSKAPEGKAGK
jgi:hypothetical protein